MLTRQLHLAKLRALTLNDAHIAYRCSARAFHSLTARTPIVQLLQFWTSVLHTYRTGQAQCLEAIISQACHHIHQHIQPRATNRPRVRSGHVAGKSSSTILVRLVHESLFAITIG